MFIAIVPAWNEEKKIREVAEGLSNIVDEVVVVDDNSKDNTFFEAEKAGAKVLSHKINLGQGAALETGHEYARKIGADYVLHFDGDGQFCIEDILLALNYLKENNLDILLGSRFLDDRTNIPFIKKYFIFPVSKIINKFFTGLKLSDVHNGFRILNKNALNKIKIRQNKMAHATEIVSQIKKHKLNYDEFPVKVIYYETGQGVLGGIKIIKDLFLSKFY